MIRLLTVLALVATVAMTGCGRKGAPNTPAPVEETQQQPTS